MKQQIKGIAAVLTVGIVIALTLMILTGFTSSEIRYKIDSYTVQQNDTLQSIAECYILKNTGTKREINEFREGIREANYDVIGDSEVKPGQILQIGY